MPDETDVANSDREADQPEEAVSVMVGASGPSAPRQRTGGISLPDTLKVT